MTITFSPQQETLFSWVKSGSGSVFLRARAGTGKTTTIIEACKYMRGSLAFAAYNKKIADEIKNKMSVSGIDTRDKKAGTFHSFGWNAARRVYQNTKVDEKKVDAILADSLHVPTELRPFTRKLVSLAKNNAIGLFGNVDDDRVWWDIIEHHDLASDLEDPRLVKDGIRHAIAALAESNRTIHDAFDFDDMIYVPAVRNLRIWQNDWLLVDEAQDTNQARRALARKMLRPGGRSIWVGDDRQAIYGFTGADADAIDQIVKDFACDVLPLTVTYRCPRAVVAEAKCIVPDIEAAGDTVGSVQSIEIKDMLAMGLRSSDAILCRKTAPIVSLAFQLIRKGIACHVEGREIGRGLSKLANRWRVKTTDALRHKLEDYRENEVAKLMAKGRETLADAVNDRVDTLLAILEEVPTLAQLHVKLDTLFDDNAPSLTLSTIHKSKGREWPRVFILGRYEYMPSSWARQKWQQVQEANLIYVAITRSQDELYYVAAER